MSESKKTTWWILPLFETCNQSLSEYLGDESAQREILTSIGKKNLFELRDYTDVLRYASSGLRCNFSKREDGGEIKPWIPEPWMRKKTPCMVSPKT